MLAPNGYQIDRDQRLWPLVTWLTQRLVHGRRQQTNVPLSLAVAP